MAFSISNDTIQQYFNQRNIPVGIRYTTIANRKIRYLETGFNEEKQTLILFVHGAPGVGYDYRKYLADPLLLSKARLMVYDRPGYGDSGYGKSLTAIAQQATIVQTLVDQAPEKYIILAGHSYGAPIAAKASLHSPVSALMLLAPVIDPHHEKVFWFSHLGQWPYTKWMIAKAWQVAADEKLSHAHELALMAPDWEKLTIPVVHMHGTNDFLAPPANITWSQEHIRSQYFRLITDKNLGHLIPFRNFTLVRNELLALLQQEAALQSK